MLKMNFKLITKIINQTHYYNKLQQQFQQKHTKRTNLNLNKRKLHFIANKYRKLCEIKT